MLTRTIEVHYRPEPPQHRARDSLDLADPLFHAMMRAKRAQAKSLATPEQLLAEMVLSMRLVDSAKR
jgi:hypothetical protein